MKKRFLAVFLALALCMGLAPAAFAADDYVPNPYYYPYLGEIVSDWNGLAFSVSGEDLKLTKWLHSEWVSGAGQASCNQEWPEFTASRPVTVTITCEDPRWGKEADEDPEYMAEVMEYYLSSDEYLSDGMSWDEWLDNGGWWMWKSYHMEDHAQLAKVFDGSSVEELFKNEQGEREIYNQAEAAYFSGRYAVRLEDGSIKEYEGSLRDYEMGLANGTIKIDSYDSLNIHAGATVTLSEPGDYLIAVYTSFGWGSEGSYALIHIGESSAPTATPASKPAPGATAAKPAPGVSAPLNDGTGEYIYTIKSGDSLSKIAAYYYGDMDVYKLIYERNKDSLKDANTIYAGQTIILPSYAAVAAFKASAQPEQKPAEPAQPEEPEQPAAAKPAPGVSAPLNDGTGEYIYTIKSGDSLSKIAAYYYGDMDVYKLIYERNKDSLKDANTIYAGQAIILPSYAAVAAFKAPAQPEQKPAEPAQPEEPEQPAAAKPAPGVSVPLDDGTGEYIYTVKSGDSLSKIAAYYYGDMDVYKLIYERNKDSLKDANTIYAGQTIILPSYAAVAAFQAAK